jgi:tetratricopeptide (TPR) repeat protein
MAGAIQPGYVPQVAFASNLRPHAMGNRMKYGTIAAALFSLQLIAEAAHAQQPSVIKDPGEYNTYILALKITDAAKKAAAMQDFVQKYPHSVVKIDALEQEMAAFQQAGNQEKIETTATQILALDRGNVRALAVLAALGRAHASGGDAAAVAAMRDRAAEGLKALAGWPKPEGINDNDYNNLRAQMGMIFNGAAGFAALQDKDYAKAREFYGVAIKLQPGDLQNIYQLGIAELQMSPPDANGFWYIARAMNIAAAQKNTAAAQSIEKYGKAKFKTYHGSEDGWDGIVAAARQDTPTPGFAARITAAPSPADLAVIAVRDNDPASLSISDWEYVLGYRDASPANKVAADKVWTTIQARQQNGTVKLKLPATVIKAEAASLDVAITDENIQHNTTDMRVILVKPLVAPPAAGATIYVIGMLADYTPKPFLFLMKDAEIAPAQ